MKTIVDTLDNSIFGTNGAAAVSSLIDNRLEIFSKQLTRGSKPKLLTTKRSGTVRDFVYDITLTHYARSPMNGSGEKDIFYDMFLQLVEEIPLVMCDVLPYVVDPRTGGSWKDLCRLAEEICLRPFNPSTQVFLTHMVDFYANQLLNDYEKGLKDPEGLKGPSSGVTNAAKWAPSEGKHFWDFFGKDIASRLWNIQFQKPPSKTTEAYVNYRKILSALRSRIGIVESMICAGKWSEINFGRVPSVAMQKLGRFAFPNICTGDWSKRRSDLDDRITCAERFMAYKESVRQGTEKIHGSAIGLDGYGREFEYASFSEDQNRKDLINLQFGDLLTTLRNSLSKDPMGSLDRSPEDSFDISSMIPIVDVSGSMDQSVSKNVSALNIAIQMGLIFSELSPESDFYQRLITFSENPRWINTSDCETYLEKYVKIRGSQPGFNTNFAATFRLILEVAKSKQIPPEIFNRFKMIVFSDMQFDEAEGFPSNKWSTLHEILKKEYSEAGYEVPGMIYWNLCSVKTSGFVVNDTEPGVVMVSGFGTGQLKQILAGELKESNPLQKMYEILDNPVFDDLKETVKRSLCDNYSLV